MDLAKIFANEIATTLRTGARPQSIRAWSDNNGLESWSKQYAIMESVQANRRTAVQSSHSSGKTHIAARIAAAWIDIHPPGEAFVITTAPTAPQVKALLWREIGRFHRRLGLRGRVNLTEWYMPTGNTDSETGEELVAMGRKTSDNDDAAFQGLHAKYMLAILDEASGVHESLWVAIETICSSKESRILAIGNPDVAHGAFQAACESDKWHHIKIGRHDMPFETGEKISTDLANRLMSRDWADDMRESWGENSAWYQIKVLGEFVKSGSDPWAVFPYQHIATARYRTGTKNGPVIAGIDIGATGDRTVAAIIHGDTATRIATIREPDSNKLTAQLLEILRQHNVQSCAIDATGIGWAVAGRIKQDARSTTVWPVNFAAKSSTPKRFADIRAQMFWALRDRLGEWVLPELTEQDTKELAAIRYLLAGKNLIRIEKKDDIKKRIGTSPDIADALALAAYAHTKHTGKTTDLPRPRPKRKTSPYRGTIT